MAHRALTLKYRPQTFADMVGQEHVSDVLGRAIESGRVAHAYLLTCARGVGKTTSARLVAKALNCENRQGAEPCNVCTSCTEITAGVSLDVAEIDGASNRGIADVQALREKVRFSPTGGRYRIVIIDEVHQLSNDAFAALLKTLEEPPPHLVFIFATTDPQKVPETIRSRTQRFDYARVPVRKIVARLTDIAAREAKDPEGTRFTLTEGAAILIAQKSEGGLRDAISALDQVVSSGEPEVHEELVRRVLGIADREAFFDVVDAVVRHDPAGALQSLHRGFEKGLDARDLAEGLSEHVRHVLILRIDPKGADLVPVGGEELARMRAQSEGWSETDLLRLLRIASEALGPMRDSPQPLVHLEAAVLQMATLEPGESLATLLERLDALERRLGGGAGPSSGAPAPGTAGGRGVSAAPGSIGVGAGRGYSVAPAASGPAARMMEPPAARPASLPPRPGGGMSAPRAMESAATASPPAAPPAASIPASAPAPSKAPARATASRRAPASAATATALAELPTSIDPIVERSWRDVITGVNGRKRVLGAFLEESRFLGCSDSALVLATDDLHRAVIEDQENRALVGEEILRVFGRTIELHCAPAEAAVASAAPPTLEPKAADVQQMIDRAIEWFHGEDVAPEGRKENNSA